MQDEDGCLKVVYVSTSATPTARTQEGVLSAPPLALAQSRNCTQGLT